MKLIACLLLILFTGLVDAAEQETARQETATQKTAVAEQANVLLVTDKQTVGEHNTVTHAASANKLMPGAERADDASSPELAGSNGNERSQIGRHVASNQLDATSMILSLLMVLCLIIVAALTLKRFQPYRQQSASLKVITSLSLSAKEKLVVVQVGEQQLLLGVGPQQINLLHSLEQPLADDAAFSGSFGNSFSAKVSSNILSLIKNKSVASNEKS